MNQKKPNPIRIRLAEACIKKGWGMEDLARATGLDRDYLRKIVRGELVVRSAWRKIESVCGARVWHTAKEFKSHERALSALGLDAITENADDVRLRAKEAGLIERTRDPAPSIESILEIIDALPPEEIEALTLRFPAPPRLPSSMRPPSEEALARLTPEERAELEMFKRPTFKTTQTK